MNRRRRYPAISKSKSVKSDKRIKRARILKIKPGAEAGLKKIFVSIGTPEKKAFKPDPFQLKALYAIEHADCLVTVPTGAGKTWIAERAIARLYEKGKKAWYASPLKALSNAKYHEFSKIFGAENVGILTGDRKENTDAPITVGTTEILRNQLYDSMHSGKFLSTDLVVLDEAHFLGDPDRGVVWEEIMIYLPPRIPLLLLSATIGNAHDIADWLFSIRKRECIVVEETKRPVPLVPIFFHPSGTLFPFTSQAGSKVKAGINKKVEAYLNSKNSPVLALPRKLPPFGEIMRVLKRYRLLPAIFFLKSRADCDNALNLCAEKQPHDIKTKLNLRVNELIAQSSHLERHRQVWHLKNHAVGAHHSGQLPAWKLVLETLMNEGLLKAVFATSTVAAGVNFPARSIVFFETEKFNGREFLPLTSTEFHQMAGRAGRRGMDKVGFAVIIPGKFMNIRFAAKLIRSSPSDIKSQIKINFSMTLNILLSHTPDQVEELLTKSFAAFLIMKTSKRKSIRPDLEGGCRFMKKDFIRHLNFLKTQGYVTPDGMLTDDGVWASRLRVDQPLMIAEGFKLNIFPESDPRLLAAIIASFVNEQESDDKDVEQLISDELWKIFQRITKGLQPFAKLMTDRGFEVRPLFLRPAAAIYAWAGGQAWEDVLTVAAIAEGNLAMLILRTVDNLRHIRALAKEFPKVAKTSEMSIKLILREPVIMEYDI